MPRLRASASPLEGHRSTGLTVGPHTEGTACWEADQEGGRGWSTQQQDRAGGGAGRLSKKALRQARRLQISSLKDAGSSFESP